MSGEFDRYARSYDDLVERSISFCPQDRDFFLEARARRLLELARGLGEPERLRALDVGCGEGRFDRHLGTLRRLEGVDVSEAMIEEARAANPSVRYSVADGTRLPHDDSSFDLVFTSCVLHHVPPPERPEFCAELARVVRPGGLVVVFEHNPLNPLTRLAVHRCPFDEDAVLLRRAETNKRLETAGLDTVRSEYLLIFPFRWAPLAKVEHALGQVPLGAQYYVAAQRAT
jgi:SAM-dependent methyltransferase